MEGLSFTPAQLLGTVYHPIGGVYNSREEAVEAVRGHYHNNHGGGGIFRVFHAEGGERNPTLIEVSRSDGEPMVGLAIYKVLVGG